MVESQLNTHLHDINTLDCGPKVCVGLFKKYICDICDSSGCIG